MKNSRPSLLFRPNERGFALPFVALVGIVVLALGLAFLQMGRLDGVAAAKNVGEIQSMAAAELGLARAQAMALSQKRPWRLMTYNGSQLTFQPSFDPLYGGRQVCLLWTDAPAGEDANATYSVVVEDLGGFLPASGSYRIHAFGAAGTKVRHVAMNAAVLTYASFGWLTNYERNASGGRIYFADGDVIDGWAYTNDQLSIAGDPVFKGRVNSAASSVHYYSGGPPADNPDFQQGIFLDSPPIDLQAMLNDGHIESVRNSALEATGIHLGPNEGLPYRIGFNANGTATIHRQAKKPDGSGYEWEAVLTNKPLSSTNGAIYCEEQVEVSGVLEGEVTVATPEGKDIVITGELVYSYPSDKKKIFDEEWDPTDPDFASKLGLISGGDIVLDENDAADLYVMGSFAAVSGSFRNENYLRSPMKTLHLYGGLAQNRRGPVGTFGWGGGTGYMKDYKYDTRFLASPPPHYAPLTYSFTDWSLTTPDF